MCITKNHYSDKLEEANRLDQERIEQERPITKLKEEILTGCLVRDLDSNPPNTIKAKQTIRWFLTGSRKFTYVWKRWLPHDKAPEMRDPTYDPEEINANSIWALAFSLSEIQNDSAPIGWSQYVWIAACLLDRYEITLKTKA